MLKTCLKCGEEKPENKFEKHSNGNRRNVCNTCRNKQRKHQPGYSSKRRIERNVKYVRAWRERNPDYSSVYYQNNRNAFVEYYKKWRERNKEHYEAMLPPIRKAQRYTKSNGIKYASCQSCECNGKHMHHEDYNQPYWVVFLCAGCHRRVHAGLIECPAPVNLKSLAV